MDVAELAEAFKEQPLHPSTQAQLMQRVQELIGQGIDVSSLFAVMVSVGSLSIQFSRVMPVGIEYRCDILTDMGSVFTGFFFPSSQPRHAT